MHKFYLELEPALGNDIDDCCEDAIRIANQIGVVVQFNFNSVTCLAAPGGSSKALVENWKDAIKHPHQHPIAGSYISAEST